jgi:hypothetical protein
VHGSYNERNVNTGSGGDAMRTRRRLCSAQGDVHQADDIVDPRNWLREAYMDLAFKTVRSACASAPPLRAPPSPIAELR